MEGDEDLERVKDQLGSCFQEVGEILKRTRMEEVVRWNGNNAGERGDLEILSEFVSFGKMFPVEVRWKLGMNILGEMERSLGGGIEEITRDKRKELVERKIVRKLVFVQECLKMIGSGGEGINEEVYGVRTSCLKMFNKSVGFLASFELKKQEFMRILGSCGIIWRFLETLECSGKCLEVAIAEDALKRNFEKLFTSENGQILVKFWCEIVPNTIVLKNFQLTQPEPEMYKVFISYLKDNSFWMTPSGKAVTGHVILTILNDMTSPRPETRKIASATLRLITHQYSGKIQIFDPEVPESCLISLNNLGNREYIKFWDSFFQLHDILQETQIHIVQPVLKNLQIFHDNCKNPSVLVWLPIILKKMIGHDNRSIVKAGFEEFLKTGYILESSNNFILPYRQICKGFMEKSIIPLIEDHIGWILNEAPDFFQNIDSFGKFLVTLYGPNTLQIFQIVLNFLTESGITMGPHAVYFFVSSMDQISTEFEETPDPTTVETLEIVLGQFTSLLSSNSSTLGRYFQDRVKDRCLNILKKLKKLFKPLATILPKLIPFVGALNVQDRELLNDIFGEEKIIIYEFISKSKLIYEPNKSKGISYFQGLFTILTVFGDEDYIYQVVEDFMDRSVNEELVHASLPGLNFFILTMWPNEVEDEVSELSSEIRSNIYDDAITGTSTEARLRCVRGIHILENLPATLVTISLTKCEVINPLNLYLLKKSVLKEHPNFIEKFPTEWLIMKEIPSDVDENFVEKFFEITGTNFYADYRRVQFEIARILVEDRELKVERETLSNLLVYVYEEIEKCDSTGVCAGLDLVRIIARKVSRDKEELFEKIADVGWSLVFECRKSEPFWSMMESFVELIICQNYIENEYLEKYADLIFEHGETIKGMPLVLVRKLCSTFSYDRDQVEVLEKVHRVLVKAALVGSGVPKNSRVSFSIWEYLRENGKEDQWDHEKFKSDCEARALACRLLEEDVRRLFEKKQPEEATKLLKLIVVSVLDQDKEESKARKRYFQGSTTHRIKHRLLQILLVLQPHFNLEISVLVVDSMLESLSTDSPQPSVRYMGEWLVILSILKFPQLQAKLFDTRDEYVRKRLGYGAFFSTMCIHLSKTTQTSEFYNRALESLATLTLSQHLTVRIYAQTAFQQIYTRALSSTDANVQLVATKYSSVMKCLSDASAYVSGNCSKLLENISNDFYVNIFDCSSHHHPDVIFIWLPRLSGMIKDECILNNLRGIYEEKPLRNYAEIYKSHEKTSWHLKSVVADGRELGEEIPTAFPQNETPSSAQDPSSNFQKKINPWKLLAADSFQVDSYAGKDLKKQCISEFEGLIVVASLLDHVPNLGGLCRTCEIFGVEKYVVNSLKLVNDQQFQSLSVSAQNWVNILEVPVRDLESFLMTYSTKGYTILGIEQANESCPLPNFKFPKKSVLLLGNEKLGIPPELLRLVDKCIEIPQVGIIRSLNVHVTGALCIYQYASQNIL